jgi:hypothetical protein
MQDIMNNDSMNKSKGLDNKDPIIIDLENAKS